MPRPLLPPKQAVPPPRSAGILLYRQRNGETQVLLIRPGGPFWRGRSKGAWMIPKGAVEPGEAPAEAALREFQEELGSPLEAVPLPLCKVRQAGGKWVEAFAAEGDLDAAAIRSNEFELEWPPRSGRKRRFPEAEEARWMSLEEARELMLPSQLPMIAALAAMLAGG
ncbi:MAG TPA: NUDIX domain-containing protein [Sphingomicrobium sp.]|nr:NUDIX domain-containing protein [Sphingomicrobium sp.]